MYNIEATEYLNNVLAESKTAYTFKELNEGESLQQSTDRKKAIYKKLLKSNDLGFEGYTLQVVKTGSSNVYKLFSEGYFLHQSIEINNKMYGFDCLEVFVGLVGGCPDTIQLLSRNEKSRMNRIKRELTKHWVDNQKCVSMELENSYESERYDNRIVSELLPSYTIMLKDVIKDEIDFLR